MKKRKRRENNDFKIIKTIFCMTFSFAKRSFVVKNMIGIKQGKGRQLRLMKFALLQCYTECSIYACENHDTRRRRKEARIWHKEGIKVLGICKEVFRKEGRFMEDRRVMEKGQREECVLNAYKKRKMCAAKGRPNKGIR